MAVCKVYIFAVLTALVAVNLIFAEDSAFEPDSFDIDQADLGEKAEREARSPPQEPRSPPQEHRSPHQEPKSPPQEHRSPPQEHRSPPQEHRSPPQEPKSPPQEHKSPPQDHKSPSEESNEAEPNEEVAQERTFFALLGLPTSCNYTANAGASCLSCRQALTCYANNRGVLRICSGLLPYCNSGRCSFFPGAACTSG